MDALVCVNQKFLGKNFMCLKIFLKLWKHFSFSSGELSELDKPLSAFIRLSEGVLLGDLTEVPVPTRFLFILLGPPVNLQMPL